LASKNSVQNRAAKGGPDRRRPSEKRDTHAAAAVAAMGLADRTLIVPKPNGSCGKNGDNKLIINYQ